MKKNRINLNSIPELIESKIITTEDAARMIAEDIARNPEDYYLNSDDEDILSELCVQILQSNDFIFKNYKKEKCRFRTWLLKILKYKILSIIRENRLKNSGENFIKQYPRFQYEMQAELYEMDEAAFKIAHIKPFIKKTEDKISYREKRSGKKSKEIEPPEKIQEEKPRIKMRDLVSYWANRTSPKAKTALILALKSSYYITDEHIDSVCNYCEISKKLMQETIDELKNSIPERHKKIEMLQNRKTKSFNFHMKLEKQISEALETEKKDELSKKYEYHTKKWQERKNRTKTNSIKLCPTNKQLAEILGIGERQVGNYIKNAEIIAESIKKEIKDNAENS